MFRLFKSKRNKIENWEIDFFIKVFKLLEKDYEKYILQLNSGLIRGVSIGLSDIPNYVGIRYEPLFFKKFEDSLGKNFRISNIVAFDLISKKDYKISFYFTHGIILGYSIDIDRKISKYKFDNQHIDVKNVQKKYIGEDNLKIIDFVSKQELKYINQSDVYISTLEGKNYYHLKELEDGDFIGIDEDNVIYRITHDPFESVKLERSSLIDILKNNHNF